MDSNWPGQWSGGKQMPVLSTEVRNKLEKVIIEAHVIAEAGARVEL